MLLPLDQLRKSANGYTISVHEGSEFPVLEASDNASLQDVSDVVDAAISHYADSFDQAGNLHKANDPAGVHDIQWPLRRATFTRTFVCPNCGFQTEAQEVAMSDKVGGPPAGEARYCPRCADPQRQGGRLRIKMVAYNEDASESRGNLVEGVSSAIQRSAGGGPSAVGPGQIEQVNKELQKMTKTIAAVEEIKSNTTIIENPQLRRR